MTYSDSLRLRKSSHIQKLSFATCNKKPFQSSDRANQTQTRPSSVISKAKLLALTLAIERLQGSIRLPVRPCQSSGYDWKEVGESLGPYLYWTIGGPDAALHESWSYSFRVCLGEAFETWTAFNCHMLVKRTNFSSDRRGKTEMACRKVSSTNTQNPEFGIFWCITNMSYGQFVCRTTGLGPTCFVDDRSGPT